MQLVVDANPIISLLIKPGKQIELLFSDKIDLFAPTFLLEELENNKQLILSKSFLSEDDIEGFLEILKERIKIIPEKRFLRFREKAKDICPDEKDIIYFALALNLECSLWSNEKKLKEQKVIKVYDTYELIKITGV